MLFKFNTAFGVDFYWEASNKRSNNTIDFTRDYLVNIYLNIFKRNCNHNLLNCFKNLFSKISYRFLKQFNKL